MQVCVCYQYAELNRTKENNGKLWEINYYFSFSSEVINELTNLFISSSSSSHQGNMISREAKYGKTD